jgi:mRNA interferase MazF
MSAPSGSESRRPSVRRAPARWVPDRQDVIWIDCNPQAGREMRDPHPFLVLSGRGFNDRTSLVLGLPMTTAPCNVDNPFAVVAAAATARGAVRTSYVLCHQPKSFDWRARGARPHRLGRLADAPFGEACAVLNQILQLA